MLDSSTNLLNLHNAALLAGDTRKEASKGRKER
jgi:hypothetical protein